jgi:hypothetical protein
MMKSGAPITGIRKCDKSAGTDIRSPRLPDPAIDGRGMASIQARLFGIAE